VDLIELRQALRRGWVFGVVAMLLVGIAGTLALGPAESRFAARSTLVVTPRAEVFESVSTGVLRVVLPNVLVVARSANLEEDARARAAGSARDTEVETEATFVRDSGVLTLTTRSPDHDAAIAWNLAISAELVERYEADPYLIVDALDEATSAAIPGVVERNIDLIGVAILALFAGILAIFTAQRLRESGDIVARIRGGGLRVLGEVAVRRRGASRVMTTGDEQVRRLALALSNAPGVNRTSRIVVIATDNRPATAVVNAMRAGLQEIGLGTRHQVVLGPQLDDLANLHREATESSLCVAVLDPSQRLDTFIRDVRAIADAEVPVLGVVVLKRRR
jgi:hypothetical protein